MSGSKEDRKPLFCPKTGRPIRANWMYGYLRWLLPMAGLLSLVWFLIRVIPKPSRATYPCQRLAFPLASAFVTWVVGLAASVAAFRKARWSLSRRRYALAAVCLAAGVGAVWLGLSLTGDCPAVAEPHAVNQPIGTARGIYPGRVVWAHDPEATQWPGPGNGHHWEDRYTDQERVCRMMAATLRSLTGCNHEAEAWDRMFRYLNKARGKGDDGYKAGEKVAIKANLVGFIKSHRAVNTETYEWQDWQDYMNTSPQMVVALLRQLTRNGGVKAVNISVCDTLANIPHPYFDLIRREFPDVTFVDADGKFGRAKATPSNVPLYWSCRPEGVTQDSIPTCFAEAEYIINFANLKAHSGSGVTLCAKNHYGSLIRTPVAGGYYELHRNAFSTDTGIYRPLVDLMGHAHLGGKTLLYLIDGLYCGIHPVDRAPQKFKSPPFNGHWTASLLASLDPVAVDSVGFDFLHAEFEQHPRKGGVDDYLHEAAQAAEPASGTYYDPDHAGNVRRLASLGVHEHWNNEREKKYSRNLGTGEGIELVGLTAADMQASIIAPGAGLVKLADGFDFTEGPATDKDGNVYFTDQPNNRIHVWSVEGKLSTFHESPGRANGLYFDRQGNLLACADLDNELWSIDARGNHTVLVKDYQGKKLNGPNDLWERPDGGVYFTDPFYKRPYWNRGPMEQDGQHVYYLTPDRKQVVRVVDDLVQPNGIIGTPDGKLLYVADIGGRKTYVYRINADGNLSDRKLFCEMGSDGMTIDNEGNVYLTGRGVTVFNSQGRKIEQIDVDPGWTANVTFGGKDHDTLFITATKSLYALKMRVKGVR